MQLNNLFEQYLIKRVALDCFFELAWKIYRTIINLLQINKYKSINKLDIFN